MLQNNQTVQFVLYVADQKRSSEFYEKLLGFEPVISSYGMTEFLMNDGCLLGLMHEKGIAKILLDKTKHPSLGNGIPRCEIYLMVEDPIAIHSNALQLGALNVSDVVPRNWGHEAGYVQDFDGHIIAFARVI